jgi:hypothetical protein
MRDSADQFLPAPGRGTAAKRGWRGTIGVAPLLAAVFIRLSPSTMLRMVPLPVPGRNA